MGEVPSRYPSRSFMAIAPELGPANRSGRLSPQPYNSLAIMSKQFPQAQAPCAGWPGGMGSWMRLRGMPNMAVHPVAGAMETTIIVSVRMPRRPTPESAPSNRMFTRPSSGKTSDRVVVVVEGRELVVEDDPGTDEVGAGVVVVTSSRATW